MLRVEDLKDLAVGLEEGLQRGMQRNPECCVNSCILPSCIRILVCIRIYCQAVFVYNGVYTVFVYTGVGS